MKREHVAIIGGGFSGTLLAVNLLRHDGPRATLIERRAHTARRRVHDLRGRQGRAHRHDGRHQRLAGIHDRCPNHSAAQRV